MSGWLSAAIIILLLGLYFVVKLRRKRRGRIHFLPDSGQLGWRESVREQIEVRVSGKITYDGPTMLHVLQVWLARTEPIDLLVDITPLEAAATFNLTELFLDKYPRKVVASLTLKARVVTPGEMLKRKLIFRDSNGRKFKVGPLKFPYNPGLRRVNSDGKIRPFDTEGA